MACHPAAQSRVGSLLARGPSHHDDDIDDAGDDIIVDETFTSNEVTTAHDHAGNLIDDGNFRYTYDP